MRRREHERAARRRAPGRHRRRRHALQPAQDVHDAARRRRPRLRARSRSRRSSSRSCPRPRSCGARTARYTLDRRPPAERSAACARSTATSACWCARYAYIRELGAEGLARGDELAVLNANYLARAPRGRLHVAVRHAVHARGRVHRQAPAKETGVHDARHRQAAASTTASTRRRSTSRSSCTGALMIEPTETETKETLDAFVDAMRAIARRRRRDPELRARTRRTRRASRRLDETRAARQPVLRWRPPAANPAD